MTNYDHGAVEANKQITAGIAASYLGSNTVSQNDVAGVIKGIYETVSSLGSAAAPAAPAMPEPVVSIRSSVKPDHVTCVECGFKGKMLKRHLKTAHNMTGEQYRARWSLPENHPLVAPNYSLKRRDLAIDHGLGRVATS